MRSNDPFGRLQDRIPVSTPLEWVVVLVHLVAWLLAAACVYFFAIEEIGKFILLLGLLTIFATTMLQRWGQRKRWTTPLHDLAGQAREIAQSPDREITPIESAEFSELVRALSDMQSKLRAMRVFGVPDTPASPESPTQVTDSALTESELQSISAEVAAVDEREARRRSLMDSQSSEITELKARLDYTTFHWLETSASTETFLGLTLSTLRGESFLDRIVPEERESVREIFKKAVDQGEWHGLQLNIRTASGETRTIEAHLTMRYLRDETLTIVRPKYLRIRFVDRTRKIKEEEHFRRLTRTVIDGNIQLRQVNEYLVDLYQNAPVAYFSLDPKGLIANCNDHMLAMLGRARSDVIGKPYVSLLASSKTTSFHRWSQILKVSGPVDIENRWLCANGAIIDISIRSTAYRDASGEFVLSRSVGHDVTARRALQAELQEQNARFVTTNFELSRKNKELDDFAYIVAHDLREPIRTLIMFSNFLEKDCGDLIDSRGLESLQHIVSAARRMRTMIEALQVLSKAGKVTGELAPVALGPIVEQICEDYAGLIQQNNAQVVVVDTLPDVWGDSNRIVQLLGNLVHNGLKYNRNPHPRIEIGVRQTQPSSDGESVDSGLVTITIRDNGIGIDPLFHAKIFEPFRRLHSRDEFEGSGAGLAICLKIVEAHGGRLWVESELGHGSTFVVQLTSAMSHRSDAEQAHA